MVRETIEKLHLRINDRFPDAGLTRICKSLHDLSGETNGIIDWISKPNIPIRIAVCTIILMILSILVFTFTQIKWKEDSFSLAEFFQFSEAALNEVILIGAGLVFLVTYETRRKRKRAVNAISKLRCIVHIIDAHQLTKDPDGIASISSPTPNSPKRILDAFALGRYLDYCSEMLSLVSKMGFLYVQNFDDPEANSAANELEILSTGISRKIWQKIMILRSGSKG